MKHKVSELEGRLLDAAVCLAELVDLGTEMSDALERVAARQSHDSTQRYSTFWGAGGPIIEREQIGLREPQHPHPFDWGATSEALARRTAGNGSPQYGRTALIAAMRAYVVSKLGAEVDL